ncbi:MAG: NIP7 pre-PUA domain-containing protein [Candidatus Heimdallarchaeota archaeon]
MVIEYREPTKTEAEIIRNSLLYWVDNEKLQLFNEKYHFIIGDGNWKEVFITNKATSTFVTNEKRVSPYSIGLGIGEIKNKNLLLTLSGGYSKKRDEVALKNIMDLGWYLRKGK